MNRYYISVVVSVGGAAVLALEILGTRILAPFYGASLFLWSALITVTLAALSAGYAVGGNRADRNGSVATLSRIIGIAGAWVLLIPLMKEPMLTLTEPLGLRAAVMLAATLLFFPPLFLLGMISPFAIRLRTSSLAHVGRTAGNLYAISTLASVASALLTGFFLIPNVGVTRLTLIIGGALVLTSLWGFNKRTEASRSGVLRNATLLVVALILGFLAYAAEDAADPKAGLVAIEQSPYAELRVLDRNGIRHFLIDGGIHSMIDTATGESSHRYTAVMNLPKYFYRKAGTILLVGLGGGTLVKDYVRDGWGVTAVEIDDGVIDLAERYFGLDPHAASIVHADGRQFLMTTEERYNVILLDAFGSSSIPFHLITVEAFRLAAQRLTQNGILAVNLETKGWDDHIVGLVAATLKEVFPHVLALPMAEPPNRLGNLILLASNKPLLPLREPERNETLDPDWRYGPGYAKVHAWDNQFEPDTRNFIPLTDNLNPVDLRAEEINMIARGELHQYFGAEGKSW